MEYTNILNRELYKNNNTTVSGNGAKKYTTTGSEFIDDFASISNYKDLRDISDIWSTMESLWNINPLLCVKEMSYIRLISRDVKICTSNEVCKGQKGQGLKHEYLYRLYWLIMYHPEVFTKNWDIFISIGSWNDMIELLRIDLNCKGIENNTKTLFYNIFKILEAGVISESDSDLVKKYLPQIKNTKSCTTDRNKYNNYIAKGFAKYMFGYNDTNSNIYKKYRQLKSSGNGHTWQQLISNQNYNDINFNKIPGRALSKISNSKFFDNHNLTSKYVKWIESQPVIKFKGYPYELAPGLESNNYASKITANKQFMNLISEAKKNMNDNTKFICAIDTSGSMLSKANGTNLTAYQVARNMALYYSYLLKGPFSGTYFEFESNPHIRTWYGDENTLPSDRLKNTGYSGWCGSTNFVSMAKLMVDIQNENHYNEDEFPNGLICISDGEFDRCNDLTNFAEFRNILRTTFSDNFVNNFVIVLWDIPNTYYGKHTTKFETLSDEENSFYMGGFDSSAIAFITGIVKEDKETGEKTIIKPKTPEELFELTMNQDILNKIRI